MKALFISFLLVVVLNSYSQTLKPEFSFTLYAEDAKGNRDSVILGYHPDARQDEVLDTRFADKDISDRPFDSIFEIRAHKIFRLWNRGIQDPPFLNKGMSKHLTLTHNSEKCNDPYLFSYGPHMGYILIKIKYPPLKLYWDKTLFSINTNPCISQSYIYFSDKPLDFIFPQQLLKEVTFMGEKFMVPNSILLPTAFKNNAGTLDTLQTNYVVSFQKANLTVSTNDYKDVSSIKTYPNPCTQFIHLSLPVPVEEILSLNIYTQDGSRIDLPFTQSKEMVIVQTANLPQGQYYIIMNTSNGRIFSTKFYKAN